MPSVNLKLVLFIDDLDRVLGGRNVKMLEAIQLLLNVPGAPVIVFLAIDSRIVVSSIEQHINKSIKIEDAMITGWEYLEKIVQIPFCIPEISPNIANSYLSSVLEKKIDINVLEIARKEFKKVYEELVVEFCAVSLYCQFPTLNQAGDNERGVHFTLAGSILIKELNAEIVNIRLMRVGKLLKCPSATTTTTTSERNEVEEKLCKEIYYRLSQVSFYESNPDQSEASEQDSSSQPSVPSTSIIANPQQPRRNVYSSGLIQISPFEFTEGFAIYNFILTLFFNAHVHFRCSIIAS